MPALVDSGTKRRRLGSIGSGLLLVVPEAVGGSPSFPGLVLSVTKQHWLGRPLLLQPVLLSMTRMSPCCPMIWNTLCCTNSLLVRV